MLDKLFSASAYELSYDRIGTCAICSFNILKVKKRVAKVYNGHKAQVAKV